MVSWLTGWILYAGYSIIRHCVMEVRLSFFGASSMGRAARAAIGIPEHGKRLVTKL
jgi:hypothetical protein